MYVCMYVCIYIYIYIHIEREREREREREKHMASTSITIIRIIRITIICLIIIIVIRAAGEGSLGRHEQLCHGHALSGGPLYYPICVYLLFLSARCMYRPMLSLYVCHLLLSVYLPSIFIV